MPLPLRDRRRRRPHRRRCRRRSQRHEAGGGQGEVFVERAKSLAAGAARRARVRWQVMWGGGGRLVRRRDVAKGSHETLEVGSLVRIGLLALCHYFKELRWPRQPHHLQARSELALRHLLHQQVGRGGGRQCGVGRHAARHVTKHRAEAPHVGARTRALLPQHFRRYEGGRASNRHRHIPRVPPRLPEVRHLWAVVR
eukprot:scaffold103580_cov70-Phaeocystis_antarctica.AAC.1